MLSSATGTNIIIVLISELYIVSRNCLDLLSLVPYGVQTAEKWTKRGNVVTPPTDKPDVWVWSLNFCWHSGLKRLWLLAVCVSSTSCRPPGLGCSLVTAPGTCASVGVLNPLGIKCCSKEQGSCCSVWLFESRVNIFLYSWQKWLAARWGGWIKHLWVTLSNFTAEAKPELCMK